MYYYTAYKELELIIIYNKEQSVCKWLKIVV